MASGSGAAGADGDAVLVVEELSKRYPGRPEMMFPPVVSMFQRDLFRRKKSSSKSHPARGSRSDHGLDDEDDDDLEDEEELEEALPPSRAAPDEMFWALKDVSFAVAPGAALGVLGGPGAGKSTLLRILAGQAFPTEGRALLRGRPSPLPAALVRALKVSDKGAFDFDLVLGARLVGIEPHLMKHHRREIEELAQPLLDPHGDPAPGWAHRLAMATAVVLPASVILIEEDPGAGTGFGERLVEPIRARLRSGSSLVLASRKPELVRQLCDEVIVLDEGVITECGGAKGAVRAYEAAQAADKAPGARRDPPKQDPGTPAPGRYLSDQRKLRVPAVVPAFNGLAALLSAALRTGSGRFKRIDAAADEVSVEIRFETAQPDIEAHCGVVFKPRDGEGPGIRIEFAEPLRFVRPGTYLLVGRMLPGALRSGAYEVRADAVIANPAERGASVIARKIGRVRVIGDELEPEELADPPTPHWDGQMLWRAESEWSIE